MNALAAAAGLLLILLILWDVFQAMVLTRRATRQLQLTRAFALVYSRVWAVLAARIRDRTRRENLLRISNKMNSRREADGYNMNHSIRRRDSYGQAAARRQAVESD
jgi:hypothetical protein